MKAEPLDRLTEEADPPRQTRNLFIAAGVIALIVVAVYLFSGGNDIQPAEELAVEALVSTPVAVPEPPLPPAPDIPESTPAPAALEEEPIVQEQLPPTLEESDEELRRALAEADGISPLMDRALSDDNLIDRSASFIDGLSRGLVLHKILPRTKFEEKFVPQENNGDTFLDPDSYGRYDNYAQAIASLNSDVLVASFHRFRPLLEHSFAKLGHSADDFDNALIRALDRVLATPELTDPVPLKRREAVFIFVDPALENLSAVQKQLLRMGPKNAALVKKQAAALRTALISPQG